MAVKRLFQDEHFNNGFILTARRHGRHGVNVEIDRIKYPCSKDEPKWFLEQWHSRHCVKKERFETDAYTLANAAKCVKLDPKNNVLSMTLNGSAEYEGKPHKDKRVLWPHLLLEQVTYDKFELIPEDEKPFYNGDMKKLSVELDIRMTDYKGTDVTEGILACQYMAYFYLTLKDGSGFIYFGINLFDSRGIFDNYWALDVEGRAMIYLLNSVNAFGSKEASFNSSDNIVADKKWRHVNVDLTPHIEHLIEKINNENVFGRQVTRDDFFVRGTNIGFETHGNIDCTFEIKNYNLVSEI